MDDQQVEFLPFHAINEFMVNDYRLQVLQTVFSQFGKLPGARRAAINGLVKRLIQVPGFRNSTLAPAGVKARSAATVFERQPEFVAQVLQSWADLNPDLREKVHAFLSAREWDLLPAEADRSKLPGFTPEWPEGQDYDVLGEGFAEMYPDVTVDVNDLRLMMVWLSGRLPYGMYDGEEPTEDEA
jgi:hypothetical protein